MPVTPRGEKTRRLIMDRASVVFEQRGYVAASMNHLVSATGLTRGAFYFHFESKEAVAVAIVQSQAERWQPLVAEIEDQETEPLRRLLLLVFRAAEAVQGDPRVRAAHRLMSELAAVRREAPGTFTWWVGTLRGYLDDADRRGQLPDLTPLVREGSSADPRTALAEYMVARWAGVQQAALASGRNDLGDRVVTSWVILLPWLSTGPAARDDLFAYIRELSQSTLRDSDRPLPD